MGYGRISKGRKMSKLYVVMYHYVRNLKSSRYPDIKGLDINLFKQQIEFMKQNFQFVTMEEVLSLNQAEDLKKDSVLLTFDDGYIDHYTNVFPILKANNIQGVFSMPGKIIREKKVLDVNKIHFILASAPIEKIKALVMERLNFYRGREYDIPSNEELYEKLAVANRFDNKDTIFVKRLLQVELPEQLRNIMTEELFREFVDLSEDAFVDELYMNMDQIKLMKQQGMCFGLHGYDHYWMNRLEAEKLKEDVEAALDVFDGIIDGNSWTCCYPYGSYSDEVITQIKKMGAVAGLSTDVNVYVPRGHDIYKIPRLDTNDMPPKSENYRKFI